MAVLTAQGSYVALSDRWQTLLSCHSCDSSLPSTSSAMILGGTQLIEWGGALRWLRLEGSADAETAAETAASVRRSVAGPFSKFAPTTAAARRRSRAKVWIGFLLSAAKIHAFAIFLPR